MEFVYSTRLVPGIGERTFRNPRFFTKPEAEATKVFIAGSWPLIAEAYERAGVPVADVSAIRQSDEVAPMPPPVKRGRRKAT